MISSQVYNIFKTGSITYFNASLFFPSDIKVNVFRLYAFVRKADNFVDQAQPDLKGFENFVSEYNLALAGQKVDDSVVAEFVKMMEQVEIDPDWVEAFLVSMRLDFAKNRYEKMVDTLEYIYGSAEVIGLMMGQILNLSKDSQQYAQLLGRAMQYANFIRDINEDIQLGRCYFASEELSKFNLSALSQTEAENKPNNFQSFISAQIDYYHQWQKQAEKGYKYISKRNLIPIKTASDMYTWTLSQIQKDPIIVFSRQIKPTKTQVIKQIIKNSISLGVPMKGDPQ